MKQHLVLKLRRPLKASSAVPYWVDFINDKSVICTHADADIDRVMDEAGLRFWLTREYEMVGGTSQAAEQEHGLDRTYRLIIQQDVALPPGLASALAALPQVEQVLVLDVGEAPLPRPQHELSGMQSLGDAGPGALIYLPLARLSSRGDPAVKIAVLDTGVDFDHPELQGRIVDRADFVNIEGLDTTGFVGDFTGYDDVPDDEVGHGSHVAGIIAGRGLQMDEGVAPECKLMAVRVLATMKDGDRYVGAGIVANINVGIKWAVDHGADVINMSLGIRHTGGGLPHEDVIRYALAHGVTVVAASGNDGTAERYYPGALDGVLAVGAADDHGAVASFTSFGAPIAVMAPGLRVYSSFARHGYAHASGTSQASPFVAGLVGLLKSFARSRGFRLDHDTIQQILQHTSERIDDRPRNPRAGFGLINAADALRLLSHQLA